MPRLLTLPEATQVRLLEGNRELDLDLIRCQAGGYRKAALPEEFDHPVVLGEHHGLEDRDTATGAISAS